MNVAEIQALCDAMAGPVVAMDSSGRVIAANHEARDRRPPLNGRTVVRGGANGAGGDAVSVEAVFGCDLAKAAADALADGRAASMSGPDGRVAVLPCDGSFVALLMDPAPAAARRARDAGLDALAMLAHDLRGALGNVCGAFSLIDEDLAHDPEHGERIAAMRAALAHFTDLLGAALDLEALTAGEISVKPRDVELRRFVEEVTSIWGPRLAAAGVRLHAQFDSPAPTRIRTDPMRLKQVVFNLLGNAEAHAKARNVWLTVSAAEPCAAGGARFAVTVEDDGVGLPEHVLTWTRGVGAAALFGEGRRRLGLSVVQDIAQSMGGALSCANIPGKGARIRLIAPAALVVDPVPAPVELDAPAVAPSASPNNTLAEAIGRGGVRGLKALLAEDNTTNQMVATQMLDKLGCGVEVASDGLEALQMLGRGGYDFLLVDIEMPKMSGIDVLRRLRAGEAGRADLPAIALTAYAMAEHRRKVADAGADGMIAKPIMGVKSFETDLVSILGRVLKARGGVVHPNAASGAPVRADNPPSGLHEPDIDKAVFEGLMTMIGEESSSEFLERVEADLAEVRLRIRNGAKAGDVSEIRAGAHVLISVAGAIGARSLQSTAEAMHARAAAGDLKGARALIKDGDPEFMAIAAFIYRRRAGAPQRSS